LLIALVLKMVNLLKTWKQLLVVSNSLCHTPQKKGEKEPKDKICPS